MRRTNDKLPLERTRTSEAETQDYNKQLVELNKSIGLLISLVSGVKEDVIDLTKVTERNSGSIVELKKTFDEDSLNKISRFVKVNENLTPVSALTDEEAMVVDKSWRDSELNQKLLDRLTDPKEMEFIAEATGSEFLMLIRYDHFTSLLFN